MAIEKNNFSYSDNKIFDDFKSPLLEIVQTKFLECNSETRNKIKELEAENEKRKNLFTRNAKETYNKLNISGNIDQEHVKIYGAWRI